MKKAKLRCPYFILLVLTSVLFGCISILKGNVFFILTDEKEDYIAGMVKTERINGDNASEKAGEQETDFTGNTVSSNTVSGNGALVNDRKSGTVSGNSVSGNDGKMVLDTKEAVQEYLSETLFIGDSRTATLQEYAGWDSARFYVKYGLTIWDLLDEKLADDGDEKITVDEALQKQKFKRIYIMLGINELGRGTPETFSEQYEKVIVRLKQLQPDAVIIVESIMHVTEEKDAEKTYINNTEINARNEKIKEMAERTGVYWMDVNQVTDDEESHCLVSDYSFDGVHLKVKYLDIWKNFILENPY